MTSRVLFSAVLAIMCVVASPHTVAEDAIDYQKIADGARWGWQPAMSHPLGCISQCGGKYDITLLSKKDDPP